MNAPPLGDDARDRIIREARVKAAAYAEGVREGRAAASAAFERRLDAAEKKLEALWRAYCTDDTRVIRRDEGSNGG